LQHTRKYTLGSHELFAWADLKPQSFRSLPVE
jgi:hypothetical protein